MTMIQVTLGAGPTQVTSEVFTSKQFVIQNNSANSCRLGSSSVSATEGIALSAGGGSFNWNVLGYLCRWYLYGTAGSVIDVVFE